MSEPHLGPNDIPQLYECLKAALSQDQHGQKQAEATLDELEHRHGFTSCLAVSLPTSSQIPDSCISLPEHGKRAHGLCMQEIIGNKTLDHSARWLAIIQFKNSINKHWKLRPGKG